MSHPLIEDLVNDLKPTLPTPKVGRCLAIWALTSVLLGLTALYLLGPSNQVQNYAPIFTLFGLGLFFTAQAFLLAIPGRGLLIKYLPRAALVTVVALLATIAPFTHRDWHNDIQIGLSLLGVRCALLTLGFSLTPILVAWFIIRQRFAVTRPLETGFFAAAGAACIALASIGLHCGDSTSTHNLIWHIVPVLLLAAIVTLLSRVAMRW
jgi:hypothetical protein